MLYKKKKYILWDAKYKSRNIKNKQHIEQKVEEILQKVKNEKMENKCEKRSEYYRISPEGPLSNKDK